MRVERDEKLKVLIVDDEQVIRDSLGGYLSDAGFIVELACDGRDARRVIGASEIDVALMDVLLPGKDGLAVLQELSAENPDLINDHAKRSLILVRQFHNAQDNCKTLFDFFESLESCGESAVKVSADKIVR